MLFFFLIFLFLILPARVFAQQLPSFSPNKSLPDNIVLNANQGLGVCHVTGSEFLNRPEVSWDYGTGIYWKEIEPQKNSFSWEKLEQTLNSVASKKKKTWLTIITGGPAQNGPAYPNWLKEDVPIGPKDLPVPWNSNFQAHLSNLINQLARRYDNNPTIEAVIISGLGYWQEATIISSEQETKKWEELGYSDATYEETIKKFADLYLGKNGFQKKPAILQIGCGLYGYCSTTLVPAIQYLLPTYGMRIWYKFNGWGCDQNQSWCSYFLNFFNNLSISSKTRVGFEPAFVSSPQNPNIDPLSVLSQHSSFHCLQPEYFNGQYEDLIKDLAKYLGSQAILKWTNLPKDSPLVINKGNTLPLKLIFINRGTTPLIRPKRVGMKDEVASFELQISLVKNDKVVFATSFTPNPPTYQWYGNQEVVINQEISLDQTITPAVYDVFLSILNPDLGRENYGEYFKLVNNDLVKNEKNMYKIGQVELNPSDYDLNNDGKINEIDLTIILANWGNPYETKDLENLFSNWRPL